MILKQRLDSFSGRPLSDLALDFENIFEHVFGDNSVQATSWAPRSNVSESESGYLVELELPGVSPNQVSVEVKDGILEISGDKVVGETDENLKSLKNERLGGSFKRTFKFNTPLNAEEISAEFKHGVLNVLLPKAEQVLPKKIEIKIGD